LFYIDPDKNFALEVYGDNSKCFDHTNQMWEEQTCKQVRQWQHWGSGCYEYSCQNGRLHIVVSISLIQLLNRTIRHKFRVIFKNMISLVFIDFVDFSLWHLFFKLKS